MYLRVVVDVVVIIAFRFFFFFYLFIAADPIMLFGYHHISSSLSVVRVVFRVSVCEAGWRGVSFPLNE